MCPGQALCVRPRPFIEGQLTTLPPAVPKKRLSPRRFLAFFSLEHALHSGNSTFEHFIVRLIGRKSLHLHTRPQHHFHQRVFRVTARPLHRDFIADASNYGHEQNACHNNERQLCGAIGNAPCDDKAIERRNGVYENRDDHDHDQKRRAAAHVQTRETARIFGRERQPVLVAMNSFMLGAVIAEHAFDVLHATNKPNVEHENDDTHNAVDDVPKKRFVIVFAHERIGDERGRDNEQADAQKQTKHHRDSHFALAETRRRPRHESRPTRARPRRVRLR